MKRRARGIIREDEDEAPKRKGVPTLRMFGDNRSDIERDYRDVIKD